MKSEPDFVRGDLEPATREGFAKLLLKANAFLAAQPDFHMLTIVRLEKAIAVVYVRSRAPTAITEFWEEDDVEV